MWYYFVACPGLSPLSHSTVHINYIYMSQGEFSFFQYFSYWFHLAWIMLTESINHFNLALTGQVIFFPLTKQQHCQVSILISWILLQSWKINSINTASYMGRQYILTGSLTKKLIQIEQLLFSLPMVPVFRDGAKDLLLSLISFCAKWNIIVQTFSVFDHQFLWHLKFLTNSSKSSIPHPKSKKQ